MRILLCNAKRQYLLTCKVSRYCLLALHGSISDIVLITTTTLHQYKSGVELSWNSLDSRRLAIIIFESPGRKLVHDSSLDNIQVPVWPSDWCPVLCRVKPKGEWCAMLPCGAKGSNFLLFVYTVTACLASQSGIGQNKVQCPCLFQSRLVLALRNADIWLWLDFVLQQHLLCGVSGWRGERAGRLSQPADSWTLPQFLILWQLPEENSNQG